MWKRWPSHRRPRERLISNPTLIQTTFDEETLANIPSAFEARQAQATPTTTPMSAEQIDGALKGLPLLPFQHSESESTLEARPSAEISTTSSIHSTPPHNLRRQDGRYFGAPSSLPAPYNVSPPSTPDTVSQLQVNGSHTDGSVSPVETMPDQQEHYHEAVLVPPRILFGGGMANSTRPDRDSVATRWGDFMRDSTHPEFTRSGFRRIDGSGTDTTSLKTRFVNPLQVTGNEDSNKPDIDEATPRCSPRESTVSISPAWDRLDSGEKQWMANSREEKPLPETKTIILPRKSSKRLSYGKIQIPDAGSPVYEPHSAISREGEIKPLVPLKAGRNSPSQRTSSLPLTPINASTQRFPLYNDSRSVASGNSNVRNPSKLSQGSIETLDTGYDAGRSTSTVERNFNAAMNGMSLQDQPVSRFSATTYDTETITTMDTPPRSPYSSTMSMPSSPCPNFPSPLLNRQLAFPALVGYNHKATTRKPLSYTAEPTPPSSANRPLTCKSLPPSPPEAQSVDLISSLQAQLDNLRHQRGNLQRITQDLQRLLSPGPNALDRHARADLKKTVDECNADLDEIIRQEHDVGMRLHRAWRRQERDELLDEPTGLWVRRVTG